MPKHEKTARETTAQRHEEIISWRRYLHANPEIAFEEKETAAFVAEKLDIFGISVEQGIGGTGVVGTLTRGKGRTVGLRVELDALPINETNTFDYASRKPGKMHACGHDGHMVMLLEAARRLAEEDDFRGTVRFIFQPAEETLKGALAMLDDGLLERFPVDAIFGLHNWQDGPSGTFAVSDGPMLSSIDNFDLTIRGRRSHAALPHKGIDSVAAACAAGSALLDIPNRDFDSVDSVLISIARINGGESYNSLPEAVTLSGTARYFRGDLKEPLEASIRRVGTSIASAYRATATLDYTSLCPPIANDPELVTEAVSAALEVVGEDRVETKPRPCLAGEDFAHFQPRIPGCYVWLGSRRDDGHGVIHSSEYDFDDRLLPIGASFFTNLARRMLA